MGFEEDFLDAEAFGLGGAHRFGVEWRFFGEAADEGEDLGADGSLTGFGLGSGLDGGDGDAAGGGLFSGDVVEIFGELGAAGVGGVREVGFGDGGLGKRERKRDGEESGGEVAGDSHEDALVQGCEGGASRKGQTSEKNKAGGRRVCMGLVGDNRGSEESMEACSMAMQRLVWAMGVAGVMAGLGMGAVGQVETGKDAVVASGSPMDKELMEISVPGLEALYASHKYTVTQVVEWYLSRIEKYNGTYKALIFVDKAGALAMAAKEDAEGGKKAERGALWGVPIVIKSNTSIKGLVTNDGWIGYMKPGKELVAPEDATVVAKLRAAGAVILGQTNMPDFAASDTNNSSALGRTGNAYDVRFSPGGSSGGTATAVAGNMALFGQGSDTGNSIRQPAANSSLVGMLPTRGLVSIAGIHPLDWMLDTTGPLARDVTTATIALDVMAGEDPGDSWTYGSRDLAEKGPYVKYLKKGALKGKRFGVPAFILEGSGATASSGTGERRSMALADETRQAFMRAVAQLRALGATVVIDESILPNEFMDKIREVQTRPYRQEGTERFLMKYGPAAYKTPAEFEKATGQKFPVMLLGGAGANSIGQRALESDIEKEAMFFGPQRRALLQYESTMDKMKLDGYVYPALQVPTYDETAPGADKGGPHSATGWVNKIGVPAVVVPGGFYSNGIPFGIEISGRRWKDGDLLGYAYAFEQGTKNRRMPPLQ